MAIGLVRQIGHHCVRLPEYAERDGQFRFGLSDLAPHDRMERRVVQLLFGRAAQTAQHGFPRERFKLEVVPDQYEFRHRSSALRGHDESF